MTHDRNQELPDEQTLASLYRATSRELPSAHIDRQLLEMAQQAVAKPHIRMRRWAVPLSTAAVVVLAVGAVLRLVDEGALSPPTLAPESTETVAAPPKTERDRSVLAEASTTSSQTAERRIEAPSAPAAVVDKENAVSDVAPEAMPPAMLRSAPTGAALREKKLDDRVERFGLAQAPSVAALSSADVVAVQSSGKPGEYLFSVTLHGRNTDCDHYIDWWEVVSEDGVLLYRQLISPRDTTEEFFVVNGGPVAIAADTTVWIRAHTNGVGYASVAFKGSAGGGFVRTVPPPQFAQTLADQPPLPTDCRR